MRQNDGGSDDGLVERHARQPRDQPLEDAHVLLQRVGRQSPPPILGINKTALNNSTAAM